MRKPRSKPNDNKTPLKQQIEEKDRFPEAKVIAKVIDDWEFDLILDPKGFSLEGFSLEIEDETECPECKTKCLLVTNPDYDSVTCPLWEYRCPNPKCMIDHFVKGRYGYIEEISRKDKTKARGKIRNNYNRPLG